MCSSDLLPPIFGLDKSRAAMGDADSSELSRLSRSKLKAFLGRNSLGLLRDAMLRLFCGQVLRRGLIAKALPLAGGILGALAGWREVAAAGGRVIAWLEEAETRAAKGAEP